jgi:hypothetical protein
MAGPLDAAGLSFGWVKIVTAIAAIGLRELKIADP